VSIKVVVSADRSINAISGTVLFPKNIFTVESISKSCSILNFWVAEPSFSNSAGTFQFEGVSLSGFNGDSGNVLTVNLKAIKEGEGSIIFKTGQILANDGQGTNVTSSLNKGNFVVLPGKVAPKTEPVEVEKVVVAPEKTTLLVVPTINLSRKDGIPSIEGYSSYPRADVLLSFVSKTNSKVFISGFTESKGEFNIIIPNALRDGSYSVNAVIVLSDGTHSPPSNLIDVKVGTIFNATSILLGLVLILMILLAYLIRRRILLQKKSLNLGKEVKEVEQVVKKTFENIRSDLADYEDHNRSVFNRVPLDDAKMSKIKTDLKKGEQSIEEQIADLEK
jgi:hypothetical protein